MKHLLFFTGTDCSHCEIMKRLVERLEVEFNIEIQTHDIWQDEKAYRLLENYTQEKKCDGVPVFVNSQTGVVLCGEISYKQLQSWAMGGNVVQ
jgi:glutaredoxin